MAQRITEVSPVRPAARRIAVVLAALAGVLTPASMPRAADTLKIGVSAWPSAEVTAHIIAGVAKRLGLEAELRPGSSAAMLQDLAGGGLDVYPEIWFPNLQAEFDKANANGAIALNTYGVETQQNICVTRATQEQTGIQALSDLARPEIAAQFDTNNDGKGEIWIGDESWRSTQVEQVRAQSYGYAETMTLLQAPEDVAMAAVDVSASIGSPIVFYCYRPHHIFGLHKVVALREPRHDASRWSIADAKDPDWLKKSRADSAWGASRFHVGYAASLKQRAPEMARFLTNISFDPPDIDKMSYAVQVDRKPAEKVAEEWMAANAGRIGAWMQR